MERTPIIGLGHRKRVGKDTLAKLLVKECQRRNLPCQHVSIASTLKDTCHLLFGHYGIQSAAYYDRHDDLKDQVLQPLGMTPRDVWLAFVEPISRINPNTLVDSTIKRANPAGLTIISDVRFYGEITAIRLAGGIVLRVDRPSTPTSDDLADGALSSEPDTFWDGIVKNDSSERALLRRASQILDANGWVI